MALEKPDTEVVGQTLRVGDTTYSLSHATSCSLYDATEASNENRQAAMRAWKEREAKRRKRLLTNVLPRIGSGLLGALLAWLGLSALLAWFGGEGFSWLMLLYFYLGYAFLGAMDIGHLSRDLRKATTEEPQPRPQPLPHSVDLRFANGEDLRVPFDDLEEARAVHAACTNGISMASRGGRSVAEELDALAGLRNRGLLSDQDWERAKGLFLGKPEAKRKTSIEQLKKLHDLYKDGVLSEGEFNMKKWDVLAEK